MDTDELIQKLRSAGWSAVVKHEPSFILPAAVKARYPRLPSDLVRFLSMFSSCVATDETSWFLCDAEFSGSSGSAFTWDEWERLSLGVVGDDSASRSEITEFWDRHFPFLLSVRSGYSYFAVCVDSDRFGRIVEGLEPAFEEASPVADSFDLFLTRLLDSKKNA
jgi:hypothetical protein